MESVAEEWRDVVGFPGMYEVSSMGRVRSFPRTTRHKHGGPRRMNGRVLKPGLGGAGYLTVVLAREGRQISRSIHSLVVDAFIGPVPSGCNINHKSGIKTDNCLSNLEVVTYSENMSHAYRAGLAPRGERSGVAKLSDEQVRQIRDLARAGMKQVHIAKKFDISQMTISDIVNGRSRKMSAKQEIMN